MQWALLLIPVVPALITGWVTWMIASRREKAEAAAGEQNRAEYILDAYREAVESYAKRLEEAEGRAEYYRNLVNGRAE